MPKKKRPKGTERASRRPGWIGAGVLTSSSEEDSLTDAEFNLLYKFFVLECPCLSSSYMSTLLSSYGWGSKPWQTKGNRLRARLLTDLGFSHENGNLFSCDSANETADLFRESSLDKAFKRSCTEERIAFFNMRKNQFVSIACHARNCLAHGRYAVKTINGEKLLYFEDVIPHQQSVLVRARMVIKLSTLFKWKDIITKGPKQNTETNAAPSCEDQS